MKKHFVIPLLAWLIVSGACQRSKETKTDLPVEQVSAEATTVTSTQSEEEETEYAEEENEGPAPIKDKVLSSSEIREKLTEKNPSALLMTSSDLGEAAVYNGFYGIDHYRIEIYFASIEQDPNHPNVFWVIGKSRYKKNINPFKGEITLDQMTTYQNPAFDPSKTSVQEKEMYSTTGTFEFREDSTFTGSGIFKGSIALDYATQSDDQLNLWYYSATASKGSGFLFDGKWTSYKTKATKPIIWSKSTLSIAEDILENFNVGERDVIINPKYRRLGWENYWENDEWWNDSKTVL
jgi:hypothetical protein